MIGKDALKVLIMSLKILNFVESYISINIGEKRQLGKVFSAVTETVLLPVILVLLFLQ